MTPFIQKNQQNPANACGVLDSVEVYPWELSTPDARPTPANLAALGRNLARREGASFFLQKATWRFYPDFVCKLNNETTLIVEYKGKGADRWNDPADDRLIGGLWEKLSGGACRFVMLTNKQFDVIDPLLT